MKEVIIVRKKLCSSSIVHFKENNKTVNKLLFFNISYSFFEHHKTALICVGVRPELSPTKILMLEGFCEPALTLRGNLTAPELGFLKMWSAFF